MQLRLSYCCVLLPNVHIKYDRGGPYFLPKQRLAVLHAAKLVVFVLYGLPYPHADSIEKQPVQCMKVPSGTLPPAVLGLYAPGR